MKSGVLLSSNLPSVIDQSNLSQSRKSKLLDNSTRLFICYFYSNDPRDPENERQNRFSEQRLSEKKKTVTTS